MTNLITVSDSIMLSPLIWLSLIIFSPQTFQKELMTTDQQILSCYRKRIIFVVVKTAGTRL